jgi:hypothetical protein
MRNEQLPRTSVITNRQIGDLPTMVLPGTELECVIRPQMFVVLHHIRSLVLTLVRLRIGAVEDIPFELEGEEAGRELLRRRHRIPSTHSYHLVGLDNPELKQKLARCGLAVATVAPIHSIALPPAIDVVLVLRNDTKVPVQAIVGLVVLEELR